MRSDKAPTAKDGRKRSKKSHYRRPPTTRTSGFKFSAIVSPVATAHKALLPETPLSTAPTEQKVYAVKLGHQRGIYTSWVECWRNVSGYKKNGKGPIYKGFPSLPAAEAWLRGDIPRGALVDSKLPDALRWDGVVLSDSLIEKIKSRGQPHRPASKMGHRNRKEYNSTRRSEAVDQELEAFHHTLQRLELARSCGYTATPDGALVVYTDGSVYNLPKWLTRRFPTITGEPIKNQDLVIHMLTLLHLREQSNGVRFKHVKGHRGQLGNESADRLAKRGARLDPPADRNDWITLADMERIRRRNAIRAVSSTAVKATTQAALVEIAELNEQINVDVDFHASLWLSAEEVTILDSAMEL
ncbi:hypothetical protein QFC20_007628 [Naganishia adeliensis]|uniref:Uncharacterized protein n=1 Tax=Naganishia adeliensis TaxID=92952 RepID=A0ACC2UX69_9TREE|nr:hypothetical protein QFC20_007628 [Naganishia adeliensis]